MEPSIITTIITSITALLVAYIGVTQRKNQIKQDKSEELRQEGALLQLEMSQAGLKLAKVTARAVRKQQLNGDVEDAEVWVRNVEEKFADYMRRASQVV